MLGKSFEFSSKILQQSRYFFMAWLGCRFKISSEVFLANLRSLTSLNLRAGGVGKFPLQASHPQANPNSFMSFVWRSTFCCFMKLVLENIELIFNGHPNKNRVILTCSSRTAELLLGSPDKQFQQFVLPHKFSKYCWSSCD